jgi:hypothetical protein
MAHGCEERDLVPLGGSSHASGGHLAASRYGTSLSITYADQRRRPNGAIQSASVA